MLAAARNTVRGSEIAKKGDQGPSVVNFLGKQFSGSTLGIIGMGRIGQAVAERALGFGCKILYHNRSRRPDEEKFNGKI